MRRLGDDVYSRALDDHHRIIRSALGAHGGHEEGTQGDSFFATFTSPRECVAAAIEIQRALAIHEWPLAEELLVRMGIHTGEVAEMSTGLVGYEVHRAARVVAVGHGGQVLLSSATAGLVDGALSEGVSLRELGSHRLKDLGRPETIFQLVVEGLASEFEPLRSLDSLELSHNLPFYLDTFVGRVAELEELRKLVVDFRLVTLTGAGGSGKTRLALQVAAELLDGSGEGVWFVELAPVTDPVQVPSTVISAMQLHLEVDAPPLNSLVETLKSQNVLIILDNCEQVIDAVAKMAEVIGRHCPRVSIIATSREPLGVDGERVYRVRSLSLPGDDVEGVEGLEGSDAAELFVARARSKDSTFEMNDLVAPLVASVCRRLDGIPLAIELAASRLSSMSLDDLHERLDHRFRLLTGGSRNALPRQQTLAATVAWSYDSLKEPERSLLRRLSVFVGGFDLQSAEAVCSGAGVESFDVADLLSSLVNKSLVTAERLSTSLRYRLLETIRQYAAEELVRVGGEIDAAWTRRRHAEYFLHFCLEVAPELEGPKQCAWLKRLDFEYDNLLATMHTLSADPERASDVLALGVALFRFAMTRRDDQIFRFLREALASNPEIPQALRVRTLVALSRLARMVGSQDRAYQFACELSEQALELARLLGDDDFTVQALVVRSIALVDVDRWDSGLESANEAVELARRVDSPRRIAEALFAVVYAYKPPTDIRANVYEALGIFRQLGDTFNVANTLILLSSTLGEMREEVRQARELCMEAMELAEEMDSNGMRVLAWTNEGLFSFFLDEFDRAVQQSRRALRLSRRIGPPVNVDCGSLFTLACCATQQGEFLVGAQLWGGLDGIEERAGGSNGLFWSPMETKAREESRVLLRDALGDEEYERATFNGKGLSPDQVYDLALGWTSTLK